MKLAYGFGLFLALLWLPAGALAAAAARQGDLTSHGGVILGGAPTVLIGGLPAARMGDYATCPLVSPYPHVGGTISMGDPTVLIGGMPAARVGDPVNEGAAASQIVIGSATVLIGN